MPDKGKAMSQVYYERQSKLIKLYQDFFDRKEMKVKEAVTALRMIGFSETMAARRVGEWSAQFSNPAPETERDKKRRIKEQASLEKYLLRMKLGKKKYEEYIKLRSKYKQGELSRGKAEFALMQFGYSQKFSECTADKWLAEKW